MLKVPDDSVTEPNAIPIGVLGKQTIKQNVERHDLVMSVYVIPNLPVACSPKLDPVVLRVSTAQELGKEAHDEAEETQP